jgi:hypothetical protein
MAAACVKDAEPYHGFRLFSWVEEESQDMSSAAFQSSLSVDTRAPSVRLSTIIPTGFLVVQVTHDAI